MIGCLQGSGRQNCARVVVSGTVSCGCRTVKCFDKKKFSFWCTATFCAFWWNCGSVL